MAQNILDRLKNDALSITQLQLLVGPNNTADCRWLVWDDLAKFKNVYQLMEKGAVVILLQIETRNAPKVGHFICLIDHGHSIEHFDSYGLTMEEELALTHEAHLTRIFNQYPKPVVNNTKRLQLIREDINNCGRWVVARLLLREMSLDMFLKLVTHFHIHYDDTVSLMTMLLSLKK